MDPRLGSGCGAMSKGCLSKCEREPLLTVSDHGGSRRLSQAARCSSPSQFHTGLQSEPDLGL